MLIIFNRVININYLRGIWKMMNKKLLKKGAAAVLALAITIPALTPSAAIAKENKDDIKVESVKFNGMEAPNNY